MRLQVLPEASFALERTRMFGALAEPVLQGCYVGSVGISRRQQPDPFPRARQDCSVDERHRHACDNLFCAGIRTSVSF